jgi:RecJ-like exonuclease
MINDICKIKCGKIPEKESECKGYSKHEIMCKKCMGEGKLNNYSKYKCSTCHGTGYIKDRYTCEARLISDNSDFHLERQWITLLKQDLIDLVNTRRKLLQNIQ